MDAQAEPSMPVFKMAMKRMSKNRLTMLLVITAFMTNFGLPSVLIKLVIVIKRIVKVVPSSIMRI